ncbi:MAG TPA: DUF732 domain-containing protein [Coleofasciculaceae cyanobacterium]
MKLTRLALCLVTVATTAAANPLAAQSLPPQDFAFLKGVEKSIDPALAVSDQQKLEAGRSVCQQLGTGVTLGQLIAQDSQSVEQQPLIQQQPILRYYRAVQEYAIRNYCPEFSKQWRSWRNG